MIGRPHRFCFFFSEWCFSVLFPVGNHSWHDFDPHRKMRQKQFLHFRIQDSSTEDSLSLVKYGFKSCTTGHLL